MGTSKGYIAPTRIEWSRTKSAVTEMSKNLNSNSIANATSKYASAMKTDGFQGSTFIHGATGILGFAKSVANYGLEASLRNIGREDLLGKSSDVIWNELLHHYTNNGATKEDALAIDALSLSLKILNIDDFDKLADISMDVLLKEMLVNFVELNFEFRFAEKIGKERSPDETTQILSSVKGYIRSSLYEQLTIKDIGNIDFGSLSGNQYVESALIDAYTLFETLYEED
ncbi:hypothetical protein CAFE_09110 [Caprobacter fermentans]|uniref:Uncharacterized protein n=1 Tax=Caproicibacter fermentans TaxID=2576756 RepID=A0A6N8HY20_9FIRM|nr:hypothetical protein [Caproicibacter fermentans]MVB10233.1 hypothetical protein [Caproicibacter fermentans]